jgi:hypothetical protein
LLTLAEGRFSFEPANIPPGPPLVPDVAWLLDEQAKRQAEWAELCKQAPSMRAVLALTAEGRKLRDTVRGLRRLVLPLVNGHRTLADILTDSEHDAVDVLAVVVEAMREGLLSDSGQPHSLFPLPTSAARSKSRQTTQRVQGPPPPRAAPTIEHDAVPPATAKPDAGEPLQSPASSQRPQTVVLETARPFEESGTARPPPLSIETIEQIPQVANLKASKDRSEDALPTGPSDPTRASLAPGRFVGRYQVLLKIGRGSTGSVYLCRHSAEGGVRRLFALKLLHSALAEDPRATESFLAEARLAAELHHPNVVGVLDAGVAGQRPYLIMDYVEGCRLKRLLMASRLRPAWKLVVPVVLDTLAGLHAIHSLRDTNDVPLGVVHGDISPENLLVGVDGACRVTGIGVAHAQANARRDRGRPGYRAPEQVQGQPVDRRADVFAVGVVLWSALTGQGLFSGWTAEETLEQVCTKEVLPPSQVGWHPPPAFDPICLKALARSPENRYQNAEEMHRALSDLAQEQNLLVTPADVTAWVRATVGSELAHRRLLMLDASRG